MKYSIFQYSQEKLLEYNLDVIDALILSWFSDFFVGSMEKRIFKDENTNTGKLFGWVKLSKVMEDLPCIGINSEKGIKRRFDNFVEKGILERKSLITQNGKKTYYRATENYETLINTKIREHNQNGKEELPHDYQNIHAENKTPHRTKTTNADIKTPKKSSHDYQNIYADGNENILAHTHQNIHALNYSAISDDMTTDAAIIKSETEKIFGDNYFDSNFPEKAAAFFFKNKINDFDLYFSFIKNKLDEKQKSKQVKNPRGLAYRLFFQSDIAQEFIEQQQLFLLEKQKEDEKQRKIEARKITCPCCGKNFLPDYISSCPECDFDIDAFSNTEKVKIHQNFLKLTEQQKAEYQKELKDIYFGENNFANLIKETPNQRKQNNILREQKEKELNIKYGLVG